MLQWIDRVFLWIRSKAFFYRFTLLTRILLAAAFIPSGTVKLLGERFTLVSTDSPVGAFFEAMYQTGFYWRFLGASQVIAGVLLLFPRAAHLGAAIFLPIIVNIFIITVSLGFQGTPFVTGPMLLAVVYLCMWDYHRFRPMLTESPLEGVVARHRLDLWEAVGFTTFALALIGFFLTTRSLLDGRLTIALVIIGLAAGLFSLGRFLWISWRSVLSEPTMP